MVTGILAEHSNFLYRIIPVAAFQLKYHPLFILGQCYHMERFDPEVKHMIIFDVLSRESPIGDKGHRMRLFLTEAGYKKALSSVVCLSSG